jgi:2,4-dienoyl-CoA reductase-like NADH-dependent reductase (Old Yellow Enzyme family)
MGALLIQLLIQPIKLRGLTVTNLISPMAQFSATNGTPGDWHMVHLGQFALSGAGVVLPESTYSMSKASNTPTCLSLYSDSQEQAVMRIKRFFDAQKTFEQERGR